MKFSKTSMFGFFLIFIMALVALPCWWQVAKWLSGHEDFITGSEPHGWLVMAILATAPMVFIIVREMKQYKKQKETKINN